MRVLFAGGKNIGCGCLDYLLGSSGVEVVGVVVNRNSDAKSDRWYRSASEIAFEHGVPVYSPKSINSKKFVEFLKTLSLDLIVVVYYDGILKKEVISIPENGCINIHMALAENYRGCYPTTWAIMNGECRTGVTLHYINEGIDSGDIIADIVVSIDDDDTGKSLYYKCTDAGIRLFKETFPSILNGTNRRRPQLKNINTLYYFIKIGNKRFLIVEDV